MYEVVDLLMQSIDKLTPKDVINLYCKMNNFNYPQMHKLAMHTHDLLVDELNTHQNFKFPNILSFIVIKSLALKSFLSFVDKKILEMFIYNLQFIRNNIDNSLYYSLCKALVDLNLSANISDHNILSMVDSYFENAIHKMKEEPFKIDNVEYLLECRQNSNQAYRSLIKVVYERLGERILEGRINLKILK